MQNEVQHYGTYVRSQFNQRPTCDDRAKIPWSFAASCIRSLRVSIYLWAWSFKIRSIACKLKNEVRFITFVARSIVICEYMRRVSNWNSSRPTGKYINSNLAQWAGQLWPGQSLLFENVLDQYFRAFIYDTCRRSRRSGKELSILTPFFPSSSSILNISFLLNNNAAVQKR